MNTQAPYKEFTNRLKLLVSKHPNLITMTLSNIFTMRLIGNKTHGDLAEIAIAEFVNQYMYDFRSIHVGKDLYRAKSKEEDIKIINEITKAEFPVSLKAYGDGPLQLSTDKNSLMFRTLSEAGEMNTPEQVKATFDHLAFSSFAEINVLPLIYDEKRQRCNILVFDFDSARAQTKRIIRRSEGAEENILFSNSWMPTMVISVKSGMVTLLLTLFNGACGRTRATHWHTSTASPGDGSTILTT